MGCQQPEMILNCTVLCVTRTMSQSYLVHDKIGYLVKRTEMHFLLRGIHPLSWAAFMQLDELSHEGRSLWPNPCPFISLMALLLGLFPSQHAEAQPFLQEASSLCASKVSVIFVCVLYRRQTPGDWHSLLWSGWTMKELAPMMITPCRPESKNRMRYSVAMLEIAGPSWTVLCFAGQGWQRWLDYSACSYYLVSVDCFETVKYVHYIHGIWHLGWAATLHRKDLGRSAGLPSNLKPLHWQAYNDLWPQDSVVITWYCSHTNHARVTRPKTNSFLLGKAKGGPISYCVK